MDIIAHILFEVTVGIVMKLYQLILGTKAVYTNAPEEVLSESGVRRTIFLYHLAPSIIIAIALTLNVLPKISPKLEEYIETNSNMIWLYIMLLFILNLFVIGHLIEKIYEWTNKKYKAFKQSA